MEVYGEMGKELADFILRHFAGVSFLVKEDEAFNPIGIRILGLTAEVLDASDRSDPIE
jgi:hypothetical protein